MREKNNIYLVVLLNLKDLQLFNFLMKSQVMIDFQPIHVMFDSFIKIFCLKLVSKL